MPAGFLASALVLTGVMSSRPDPFVSLVTQAAILRRLFLPALPTGQAAVSSQLGMRLLEADFCREQSRPELCIIGFSTLMTGGCSGEDLKRGLEVVSGVTKALLTTVAVQYETFAHRAKLAMQALPAEDRLFIRGGLVNMKTFVELLAVPELENAPTFAKLKSSLQSLDQVLTPLDPEKHLLYLPLSLRQAIANFHRLVAAARRCRIFKADEPVVFLNFEGFATSAVAAQLLTLIDRMDYQCEQRAEADGVDDLMDKLSFATIAVNIRLRLQRELATVAVGADVNTYDALCTRTKKLGDMVKFLARSGEPDHVLLYGVRTVLLESFGELQQKIMSEFPMEMNRFASFDAYVRIFKTQYTSAPASWTQDTNIVGVLHLSVCAQVEIMSNAAEYPEEKRHRLRELHKALKILR